MSSKLVTASLTCALLTLASCSRSPVATPGTADASISADQSSADLQSNNVEAIPDAADAGATPVPDVFGGDLDASEKPDAASDSSEGDQSAPQPDQAEVEFDSGGLELDDAVGELPPQDQLPAGPDATTLDAPPSVDTSTSPDALAAPDLSVGPDGKCKDWRVRGDNKSPGDMCWNPPNHYCSSPWEAQLMWFGCKPDFSVCCNFYTLCRQCDWKKCPSLQPGDPAPGGSLAGCPDGDTLAAMKTQPDLCKPYLPNFQDKFCYDNAPAEWSTMLYHYFDGI